MAIIIDSVNVKDLTIQFKDDDQPSVIGWYNLELANGQVISRQTFNGYSQIKYIPSEKAKAAIDMVYQEIVNDLNGQLMGESENG